MGKVLRKPIVWIVFFSALVIFIFILVLYPFPKPSVSQPPKPGKCLIMEEEYCSQAERFTAIRQGKTYTYIGFNLPAGTPLFAPVDGLLQKTQESGEPFSGLLALVIIPVASGGGSAGFSGDLRFDNMLQKDVKSGDVIAYINNTDVKTVKGKDYNLVFGMSKRSPDGPVTDEELLRQLFPGDIKIKR